MVDPAANRRGILAMVACMASFAVNDAFMKLAAATLPVSQAIVGRNIVALSLLIIVIVALGQSRDLRHAMKPIVVLRGFVEAGCAFTFITGLAHLPIADVTAIAIGSPLIITALSGPLFGESVGWRRWAAVIVGFIGVLLIVRPGGEGFSPYTLVPVLTAFLVAARDLLTRKIDPAIPSHTVSFTTTTAVLLFAAGAGLVEATAGAAWRWPDGTNLAWLALAGAFVIVGNYLVIVACRNVDMSVVTPFRYSVLVWAILIGIVVFGEWPDALGFTGAALIVGAGLYTLHREQVRARLARQAAASASAG